MAVAEELIEERIGMLQTYIHLLEKIEGVFLGWRLSKMERAVMESIDRKIGWAIQLQAVAAGLAALVLGLVAGRWIVRSPLAFFLLVLICGLVGIGLVIWIYHQARRQIARQEIRIAQLEIYRLREQQTIK
jgi:hypothetical protein